VCAPRDHARNDGLARNVVTGLCWLTLQALIGGAGIIWSRISSDSYWIVTCVGLSILLKVASAAKGLLAQPHVAQSNSAVPYNLDV